MDVLIPSLSGFCPGVIRAEKRILDLRQKFPDKTLYVLGYLINNRKYIQHLSSMQIFMSENMDAIPEDSIVAIRTHGMDQYEEVKLRGNYTVVDLTCRKVKNVQKKISEYSDDYYSILITGKKNHPEVKGLKSYARHSHVIENGKDLDYFLANSEALLGFPQKRNTLLVISQTTGNRAFFSLAVEKIKKKWPNPSAQGTKIKTKIESIDSICLITEQKEEQALVLQTRCDVSFVLGDRLSSNAHKLYKRLSAVFDNVHFIEDLTILKSLALPLEKYKTALVVSSASTPAFIEQEVSDFLKKI